jgi:hypothetical protein
MKNLKILFNLFLVCLLITSCKKDLQQSSKDAFKNLTGKYYIMKDAVSNPAFPVDNVNSSTDIFHDWYKDQCLLDDLRMFKADGDLLLDNGATKCLPYEMQTYTMKWALVDNNSKLRIDRGNIFDTLAILVNDGVTLKYERKTSAVGSPGIYIFTETWQVK